jgi:signal transduction histidine kinase
VSIAATGTTDTPPATPPARGGLLGSQRWVVTLTVAFLYTAAVLRSVLAFDDGRRLLALALLVAWLALLLAEPALSRRWHPWFTVNVVLQAAAIGVALTLSDSSDFFAILLAVPSMQATMRWQVRDAGVLIGLFALLTGLCLIAQYGVIQAAIFAAIYAGADVFLAAYALTTKRATEARLRNEALAVDLRDTNSRLAEYAARAERLAGMRERQRLARDLHDSATQTLFSMTLTARSALLLLQRAPQQVAAQLDQADELARSALREMDALSAELPSPPAGEELSAALARHLRERERTDGLVVALEVEGEADTGTQGAGAGTEDVRAGTVDADLGAEDAGAPPTSAEAAALLRIVQEALNNVAKHAGTSSATVRLRLRRPCRLEIEDRGRGFDPERVDDRGLGLDGMRERAAEIGWTLAIASSPGGGTTVVAEEPAGAGAGHQAPGTGAGHGTTDDVVVEETGSEGGRESGAE